MTKWTSCSFRLEAEEERPMLNDLQLRAAHAATVAWVRRERDSRAGAGDRRQHGGLFRRLRGSPEAALPHVEVRSARPAVRAESLAGDRARQESPGTFVDWRIRSRSLEGLALFTQGSTLWTIGDHLEIVSFSGVSPGLFDLMRVRPILGRVFRPESQQPGPFGDSREQVISYRLWQRAFGGDPAVMGRSVFIEGTFANKIIGVMPQGSSFPEGPMRGATGRISGRSARTSVRRESPAWWHGWPRGDRSVRAIRTDGTLRATRDRTAAEQRGWTEQTRTPEPTHRRRRKAPSYVARIGCRRAADRLRERCQFTPRPRDGAPPRNGGTRGARRGNSTSPPAVFRRGARPRGLRDGGRRGAWPMDHRRSGAPRASRHPAPWRSRHERDAAAVRGRGGTRERGVHRARAGAPDWQGRAARRPEAGRPRRDGTRRAHAAALDRDRGRGRRAPPDRRGAARAQLPEASGGGPRFRDRTRPDYPGAMADGPFRHARVRRPWCPGSTAPLTGLVAAVQAPCPGSRPPG